MWCLTQIVSENNHLLNVKVDEDSVETVKETYPFGTISREVRNTIEALAEGGEYEPDMGYDTAEQIYQERVNSDDYPSDWNRRRETIINRDDHQCQNCKEHGGLDGPRELVVHHIVPLNHGGTNHISNLATLCVECHNNIPK